MTKFFILTEENFYSYFCFITLILLFWNINSTKDIINWHLCNNAVDGGIKAYKLHILHFAVKINWFGASSYPAGKVTLEFGQNGTIVTELSQQLYHFVPICVTTVPFCPNFPAGWGYTEICISMLTLVEKRTAVPKAYNHVCTAQFA